MMMVTNRLDGLLTVKKTRMRETETKPVEMAEMERSTEQKNRGNRHLYGTFERFNSARLADRFVTSNTTPVLAFTR
jgi:hypothetical protein